MKDIFEEAEHLIDQKKKQDREKLKSLGLRILGGENITAEGLAEEVTEIGSTPSELKMLVNAIRDRGERVARIAEYEKAAQQLPVVTEAFRKCEDDFKSAELFYNENRNRLYTQMREYQEAPAKIAELHRELIQSCNPDLHVQLQQAENELSDLQRQKQESPSKGAEAKITSLTNRVQSIRSMMFTDTQV